MLFHVFFSNPESWIECKFADDIKLCSLVDMVEGRDAVLTGLWQASEVGPCELREAEQGKVQGAVPGLEQFQAQIQSG